MPRLLKVVIPYVVAVLAAVAIFAAGAYASAWFSGRVLTPRFGLQEVADLATNHTLLQALDAGNVDEARSMLIVQEDFHLISLDMLAPYLSDDLAKSTCRIMQKVAKQRADNAAKYSATEATSDPGVRQMVATSLQKTRCLRACKVTAARIAPARAASPPLAAQPLDRQDWRRVGANRKLKTGLATRCDKMTIEAPAFFGLIARKNGRTLAYIEQRRSRLMSAFRKKDPNATSEDVDRFSVQDQFLFAFSVAMNGNDLARAIEEIERAGCVRGVDFVVTSHFDGVLDKSLPNWLSVENRPVTLTPEELSKMDPILRKANERQPPRMAWFYTFVPAGH